MDVYVQTPVHNLSSYITVSDTWLSIVDGVQLLQAIEPLQPIVYLYKIWGSGIIVVLQCATYYDLIDSIHIPVDIIEIIKMLSIRIRDYDCRNKVNVVTKVVLNLPLSNAITSRGATIYNYNFKGERTLDDSAVSLAYWKDMKLLISYFLENA